MSVSDDDISSEVEGDESSIEDGDEEEEDEDEDDDESLDDDEESSVDEDIDDELVLPPTEGVIRSGDDEDEEEFVVPVSPRTAATLGAAMSPGGPLAASPAYAAPPVAAVAVPQPATFTAQPAFAVTQPAYAPQPAVAQPTYTSQSVIAQPTYTQTVYAQPAPVAAMQQLALSPQPAQTFAQPTPTYVQPTVQPTTFTPQPVSAPLAAATPVVQAAPPANIASQVVPTGGERFHVFTFTRGATAEEQATAQQILGEKIVQVYAGQGRSIPRDQAETLARMMLQKQIYGGTYSVDYEDYFRTLAPAIRS